MIITDLFKAMKIGEELKDPAKWKVGQMLFTAILGAIGLLLKYVAPDYDMPPEMADTLANAIMYALVFVNLWLTKATSRKV